MRSIPFLGNVRTAQLLAIMATPHRFRTKRNLWPYAGLAVVTRSSADQDFAGGQLRRRTRAPRTRGLNRKHNPMLKSIFKGAAGGTKPEMAKVTLARKIASIALRLWKKESSGIQKS